MPLLCSAAGETVRFRTRKHFAVLIRLAVEPGRPLTRDHLIELLWGSAPDHLGRHSLAQAVTVLRAKLGHANVLIHRSTVAVNAGVVDVDLVHLDDCAVQVHGRFLEGFDIPGARAFEDWRDAWNVRVMPRLRDCLVRHMDAGRRIGDFATVERHAGVLAELEPLSEDALRGRMEARAWVGDRTNALKAYAEFEQRLGDELGAKPAPELVRIANLLREGRRSPFRQPSEPAPEAGEKRFEPERLIGREREFGRLYDAWVGVRKRQPCVMVITGDPGVGKTTLTNAFVSTCQMEGAVVARAQAYDAERELPFAVLAELVRQLTIQRAIGSADPEALSELSRICSDVLVAFPGVPKPVEWSAEMVPLRLADAFLKMITAVSDDNPLVLVIDDVHAADGASIGILHVVARKLGSKMLLFLCAARSNELRNSGPSTALLNDASLSEVQAIKLEPLSEASARTLIKALERDRGIHLTNAVAARVLAAGSGNPLALELLVREWQEHGAGSLLNDIDKLNTLPAARLGIPRAIQAVFDRQVPRFDRRTRSVLDLAAVLGRRCADLGLYRVVGISVADAADSLARLCDDGLLREVHGELEFRNELLRAQAYYAVSALSRQHLHRLIAHALSEDLPAPGENRDIEIAWHFLRAGDHEGAHKFVTNGARRAIASGAPAEAQRILEAFGSVKGGVDQLASSDRLLLAKAIIHQSKAQDALPVIEGLLASAEMTPEEMAVAAGIAATAEHLLNRDVGIRYGAAADKALALARAIENQELVARALFESARAGAESGNEERIAQALVEITDLLSDSRAVSIPMAHYARAFCEYYSHNPRVAVEALETAKELLGLDADPTERSRILTGLAVCEVDLCHFERADDAFNQALQLALKIGDDSRASIINANLCMLELVRGRFQDAVERGLRSLEYARTSLTQPMLSQSYLNLCEAYLMLGELERAAECQENARTWLGGQRNWKANVEFLCQAAYGALLRGNTHEALEMVGTVERLSRGRQRAIAPPVGVHLLMLFKLAHVSGPTAAMADATAMHVMYRETHPLLFLDAVAAIAWLEQKLNGSVSDRTQSELRLFDSRGAIGRRRQLIQEGFISPSISPNSP